MDAVDTGKWARSAGTMDEPFCIASKGSFASRELTCNEAHTIVDCTAPSKMEKKSASEVGGFNCSAFWNDQIKGLRHN